MKRTLAVALGIQAISAVAAVIGLVPSVLTSLCGILFLAYHIKKTPKVDKRVLEEKVSKFLEEKIIQRTEHLVEQVNKLEQQAMTDALTGLLNRRGGEEAISHHIARSLRIKTGISFILIDIDHFKQVNDRYGHATGDLVIETVSSILKANLRNSDFAARWGGEEFLICAPDTDLEGALVLAEKLRKAVEKMDVGLDGPVTISLGCAELGEDAFHIALARADMHLYFAKSKGRNQIFPKTFNKKLDGI